MSATPRRTTSTRCSADGSVRPICNRRAEMSGAFNQAKLTAARSKDRGRFLLASGYIVTNSRRDRHPQRLRARGAAHIHHVAVTNGGVLVDEAGHEGPAVERH